MLRIRRLSFGLAYFGFTKIRHSLRAKRAFLNGTYTKNKAMFNTRGYFVHGKVAFPAWSLELGA